MDNKFSFEIAESFINAANTAVDQGDYATAAPAFGAAAESVHLELVRLYCAQGNALLSADLHADAIPVAEKALRLSPRCAQALYVKGSALFKIGQRSLAKKAFEGAASLENIRTIKMSYLDWASRCDEVAENDGDEDMDTIDATGGSARTMPFKKSKSSAPPEATAPTNGVKHVTPEPPQDNTKMQWYQSASHVSVDIYAKNVKKEESFVEFKPSHLKVHLVRLNMPDFELVKDLFEDIVVENCTWSASKFKVEIRMKKAVVGSTWKALDKEAEVVSAAVQAGAESAKRKEKLESRDKVWKSMTEKELKDYKEDDSPMALFRNLYKDGDEDMQRAMMKSYMESGGQVLSTNWDEVKKEKVVYKETKD